jgi:two-component system phosphate regulon sensor histidine kinase PhoR
LAAHGENLAAAARLKLNAPLPTEPIDLGALVTRVASRHEPLARSGEVTLRSDVPGPRVTVVADAALLERAISNVVDNAIRYNRPGGAVTIALTTSEDGQQFRLWVADNGRGITAEEFKGLTAIRRFRGDEGRNRRPGTPGLGLAIAREAADRFGLHLDLKRPGSGGMEVEFSGRVASIPAG